MNIRAFREARRGQKGQTFVETMFLLAFLFMAAFFITEVAGLWFVNNSLNNAARLGARIAAVTPNPATGTGFNKVRDAVRDNLGRNDAVVLVARTGDTVKITVTVPFSTFLLTPFLGDRAVWDDVEQEWESITEVSSEAAMRYEL